MTKLNKYIDELVGKKIEEKKILVWYDEDLVFNRFIQKFTPKNCMVSIMGSSNFQIRKILDEAIDGFGVNSAGQASWPRMTRAATGGCHW